MTDRNTQIALMKRLTAARTRILNDSPFLGSLMMHLNFGFADCGTAFTDMSRIVFDPAFESRLSDEELIFVMKHEVLHCMLEHCLRGRGLLLQLFNWACDLVVNSILFAEMGYEQFEIDGIQVQHLAPDGKEAQVYSAEEVYELLLKEESRKMEENGGYASGSNGGKRVESDGADEGERNGDDTSSEADERKGDEGKDGESSETDVGENNEDDTSSRSNKGGKERTGFDRHDPWRLIEDDGSLQNKWRSNVRQASREAGGPTGLPPVLRSLFENNSYRSRASWRELLRDFTTIYSENMDYFYSSPDRRFLWHDLILPSLCLYEEEIVRDIWFFVDTSGSVDDDELLQVGAEFRAILEQNPGLSGKISFFDTEVTDPVEFDSMEQLEQCKVQGGGGTSFYAIFRYINAHAQEGLPRAVIILTDGYAAFPPESDAMGIPVLWVIQGSEVKPPWGSCCWLSSEP